MRSLFRVGIGIWAVVFGAVGISGAQDGLTKRDARGAVTVAVTLLAPPIVGSAIKARVVLDTHSVGLDSIELERAVILRGADGVDLGPSAVEQAAGGGHHRQAVLVFPPTAQAGAVQIIVKNVGGVAERSFVWDVAPAR